MESADEPTLSAMLVALSTHITTTTYSHGIGVMTYVASTLTQLPFRARPKVCPGCSFPRCYSVVAMGGNHAYLKLCGRKGPRKVRPMRPCSCWHRSLVLVGLRQPIRQLQFTPTEDRGGFTLMLPLSCPNDGAHLILLWSAGRDFSGAYSGKPQRHQSTLPESPTPATQSAPPPQLQAQVARATL